MFLIYTSKKFMLDTKFDSSYRGFACSARKNTYFPLKSDCFAHLLHLQSLYFLLSTKIWLKTHEIAKMGKIHKRGIKSDISFNPLVE